MLKEEPLLVHLLALILDKPHKPSSPVVSCVYGGNKCWKDTSNDHVYVSSFSESYMDRHICVYQSSLLLYPLKGLLEILGFLTKIPALNLALSQRSQRMARKMISFTSCIQWHCSKTLHPPPPDQASKMGISRRIMMMLFPFLTLVWPRD